MTREEAINILTEHIRLMGDEPSLEEDRQAFEFAISALEQEPCDTISRAEALDQLEQAYNIMDATDRVKAMPSVQAVYDDAISLADAKEIIARNDSTNGKIAVFTGKQVQQMLDSLPRIVTKPIECDDAISREAAIDVIYNNEYKKDMRHALEQLPSVQPSSRKGHWKKFYQNYECSECGFVVEDSDVEVDGYEFCPICGSYNGGGTNG